MNIEERKVNNMERYIIKSHYIPTQEAIDLGHKEHDWFYGKDETTLIECPDGWSHPETGFLTKSNYILKEYGYSRKCDAVRKMKFLQKLDKTYPEKFWKVSREVMVVTV